MRLCSHMVSINRHRDVDYFISNGCRRSHLRTMASKKLPHDDDKAFLERSTWICLKLRWKFAAEQTKKNRLKNVQRFYDVSPDDCLVLTAGRSRQVRNRCASPNSPNSAELPKYSRPPYPARDLYVKDGRSGGPEFVSTARPREERRRCTGRRARSERPRPRCLARLQ
jgi:hypothetical protein